MKVLLIGEHYSDNLGDGVICTNVEKMIKKEFIDVQITKLDLSHRSGFTQEYDNFILSKKKINKLKVYLKNNSGIYEYLSNLKRNKSTLKDFDIFFGDSYDIAIFAGGALFLPCFIFQISYLVNKCEENNIPVIFNCCGFGKLKSKILFYKLKHSLNKKIVHSISIRDHENIAKQLINRPFEKNYDIALLSNENFNILKKDNHLIGLGIMYIEQDRNLLIDFWQKIIKELNTKNINWKIFCNGSSEDYEFSKQILKNLNLNQEKYIVNCPKRPDELVNTISEFSSILSFRLHSHIIATSLYIPSIAMVWDKKIEDFFKYLNLEDRCYSYYEYDIEKIINQLSIITLSKENIERIDELKKYSKKWLIKNIWEVLDE